MKIELNEPKSFQGKAIPLGASLIGTSALVQALGIKTPITKPTCVSDKRIKTVTKETADLYRFFDATEAAEFLYRCVEETINVDVPRELEYLKRHDRALRDMTNAVDIPNRAAEDFIMFMQQNNWKLPKKRRVDEFKVLTDIEVAKLESLVQNAFEDF